MSNSDRIMKFGAVIAAAGKSSRMEAFKPLLKIGALSAAEHVIKNLHAAGVVDIVLVTGHNAKELESSLQHPDLVFLRNDAYESNEMFDSIKLGLEYLKDKCRKILVSPVDVPLFEAGTARELMKSNISVAIPLFENEPGHPIVIDCGVVPYILEYNGRGGLRDAITNLALDVEFIQVSDKGVLFDMDTPADYEALVKMHYKSIRGN